MAKIRNKKTGKEIEVNEDDLHIYGLGRKKLPKAGGGDLIPSTQDAAQNNQYNFNQPNYTAPVYDYGDIDESLYTDNSAMYNPSQTYNPNVITDTPIVNTPEFNPGLSQSVIDYNKQMGRGKTNVYGSPEELSQLSSTSQSKTNVNWKNGIDAASIANQGLRQFQMGTKGFINNKINNSLTNRDNFRKATQFGQLAYADAENRPQGQIYGKDIRGSNALFANGGINLKELYTPETNKANIEVEKNEFISIPHMDNGGHSGLSEKVNFGGSHGEITNGSSGTPMNLPANTLVFSVQNKVKKTPLLAPLIEDGLLKVGDIGKPWSSVANKFKTIDDVNRKGNKFDSIQNTTADIIINMKQAKLKRLFEEGQEPEKLYGFQGKKAQLEAIQSLQQEQQMQPGQEQNQQPIAKYGMKLPIAKGGNKVRKWNKKKDIDFTKVYNGNEQNPVTINNTNPVINTPQLPVGGGENGFYSGNLTEIPIKNRSYSTPESQEALSSFNVAPNYGYTNKPEDLQAAKSRYISLMRDAKVLTPELANKIQEAKNFQELNPLAGALQNYDYAAHPQISEHYGKNVPATRKGIQYLLDKKLINAKDFPGLIDEKGAIIGSMKDFKDKKYADKLQTIVQGAEPEIQNSYARANFVDNEAYYRAPEIKDIKFKTQAEKQAYLEGNKSNIYGDAVYSGTEGLYLRPTAPNEDPMVKQPTSDPVAPTDYKFTNKAKQQDFDMPNINMGIPLPYNEKTTPLNYYKIQPEFIDPRYRNSQAQRNDSLRGFRTMQNNIGGRGTTDIANLAQGEINLQNNLDHIYEGDYNYNKQQDSQAQESNAQTEMNTRLYNQNSWYNQLEDPIRARSSAKNKQFKENQQRGLENWNEQMAFNNNSNYINDTFYNPRNIDNINWGANLNPVDVKKAKESKWNDEIEKEQYIKQKKAELGLAKNGGKVRIKPKIKLK